jgi:hypothetical protein
MSGALPGGSAVHSREARYALYLVDPGPNMPAVLGLLQEMLGVDQAGAAETIQELPALLRFYETEEAARELARRFSEFEAVAVVRPANRPLAPAPVEEVRHPGSRPLDLLLFALGFGLLGVSLLWLRDGRHAAAFFGAVLGIYVVVYFGWRVLRPGRGQ